jgi:hypothetical protein
MKKTYRVAIRKTFSTSYDAKDDADALEQAKALEPSSTIENLQVVENGGWVWVK